MFMLAANNSPCLLRHITDGSRIWKLCWDFKKSLRQSKEEKHMKDKQTGKETAKWSQLVDIDIRIEQYRQKNLDFN